MPQSVLFPCLSYKDAPAAIDFLCNAFGFARHAVYTSGFSPKPSEANQISNDHFWTEQALAASPMGWTVLRDGIYTDFIVFGLKQPHRRAGRYVIDRSHAAFHPRGLLRARVQLHRILRRRSRAGD